MSKNIYQKIYRNQIYIEYLKSCRALRNHSRTVFEKMKSWTASSWHRGIKTAF